jgi:hypothetical protein
LLTIPAIEKSIAERFFRSVRRSTGGQRRPADCLDICGRGSRTLCALTL